MMRPEGISITASLILVCVMGSGLRAEDPVPERVTFQTQDDEKVTIVADFYPAPVEDSDPLPPVVILLHMYKTDRSTWKPLIPELHKRGISALAIDLRGHGESVEPIDADLVERVQHRERKIFQNMKHDVYAAYSWLAEGGKVDLSRFGIVGASIGCTVAFLYAAEDLSVDVVVALSPGVSYMKIKTVPIVKKIEGRSLLLVSPQDEIAYANTLKKANGAITIKTVGTESQDEEANIHGTRMFGQVKGIERYIAGYLGGHLGAPSTELVVAKIRQKVYIPADDKRAAGIPPHQKRLFSTVEEAEMRGLGRRGAKPKKGAAGASNL